MHIIDVQSADELQHYKDSALYNNFDPQHIESHHTDGHLLLMNDNEQVLARCSLWWSEAPLLENEKLGIIGHFAADNKSAAVALLSQSSQILKHNDCTLAVGPMDGNTWRSYRFITESDQSPAFSMEPVNPPQYPEYFLTAGFGPMAQYRSAICNDLQVHDKRIPNAIKRLNKNGVFWRPLNLDKFEDELRAIYQLSLQSFSHNFLYTLINEEDFLAQYIKIKPYVRPELTLMAESENELLGYLFGMPDMEQAKRGDNVDTFIVKTVAVLPGRRHAGLGSVLVAESQRIAVQLGYKKVIHALMHETNSSSNISDHYAKTMRRYTLFQKRLIDSQ